MLSYQSFSPVREKYRACLGNSRIAADKRKKRHNKTNVFIKFFKKPSPNRAKCCILQEYAVKGAVIPMMRIDKYLTECNIGSRSEVKNYLKKGAVTVNGITAKAADLKIDEQTADVAYQGKPVLYQKYYYYMLNKPAGVVSATKDNVSKTVLDICGDIYGKDLFPIGRLDKDTEGLLLLTNDGGLSHRLLSPKKHVEKTYYVKTARPLQEKDIDKLEAGVDIGEEKPTQPAKVRLLEEKTQIYLTITEGKFHQVKRMLHAVGNEVVYLKRISIGGLMLDESLTSGEYRKLTPEELALLQENT